MKQDSRQPDKVGGSDKSHAEDWTSYLSFGSMPGEVFESVYWELQTQTDRGLAVLGMAFLESRVIQTIRSRFHSWEIPASGNKTKPITMGARIFGSSNGGGELGFLDKCRVAYCLGLIGPGGFRDMERLTEIRNRFAHRMSVNEFATDSRVRALCEQLEMPAFQNQRHIELFGKPNPREKPVGDGLYRRLFLETVYYLWLAMFSNAGKDVQWPDMHSPPSWYY
jgi:hypothetical protein